jgi:site-specific recombinase XerD
MHIDLFLEHLKLNRGYSEQTIRAYRSDLTLFIAFLRERSVTRISKVDHAVIRDYITHMREKGNPRFDRNGLADSSISRRLAAVSSYVEYIRATGDSKLRNPVKDLRMKWKKNDKPKPVDELTLDLLLASITDLRDRALFSLLFATGLRVAEVHQLNRDSIIMELEVDQYGREHVTGSGEVVGKGGKRRRFYVDETTLEIYADYLAIRIDDNQALFLSERKQRLSIRAIQSNLGTWCRKLGFSHINVHRLRHSYATRLANANISSLVLKDLMGHSSFTTTQRYFKLNDTTIARGYFSAMEYMQK